MSKYYNPITQELLAKPDQPTSKTWEELDVPKHLASGDGPPPKKASPAKNPYSKSKSGSKSASSSKSIASRSGSAGSSSKPKAATGIKINENYSIGVLATWTDTQLKRYIGQNRGLKKDGWEVRVEMAELVVGQRGDVL